MKLVINIWYSSNMDDTLPPKNLTFDILTFSSTLSINYGRIIVYIIILWKISLLLSRIMCESNGKTSQIADIGHFQK